MRWIWIVSVWRIGCQQTADRGGISKHPHVLQNNTPMFLIKTPGCFGIEHPGVF